MSPKLHVEPQQPPMGWEQFKADKGPFSIAVDGYVNAGPRFERDGSGGPYLNIDHHTDVDRLTTLASCGQALHLIRMGLRRGFTDGNGDYAPDVYVNDCDQDICLAWFLLDHVEMCEAATNPLINKLVYLENALDVTAGMYPFRTKLETLQELAWVFQPYTQARLSGELAKKDATTYEGIITATGDRIQDYLDGKSGLATLDTTYKCIGGGKGWSMVEEIGAEARMGLVADDIDAFVSVRKRQKSGWDYTVGVCSLLIPFDVPKILSLLDEREGNPEEHWGGSNTIGGSPRVAGSSLAPDEVERVINEYLRS